MAVLPERPAIVASTGYRHIRAMVDALLSRRAERHHQIARRLAEQGDVDAALARFEKAAAVCPGRLDWLVEYGRVALRNQRWALANSAFDRVIAQRPGVASWYLSRARALVALGRHEDAIADFRRAVDVDPNHGSWFLALGRALASTGALADGIAALERAVELDASKPERWVALALLQRQAGATEDAVEAFGRALALRTEPKWYALRARGLMELGRDQEAIGDLRRAVGLDPKQIGWWLKLAHLLASSGQNGEAVEAYRAALTLDDRQARVHASLARLMAGGGDIDAAIEHLARAVDLDGDHPDWRADLRELRESASARSVVAPALEKDAYWYDTVYQHSEKYRLHYEHSTYWPVWQRILDKLAAFRKPAILEIGCGPGQLATAIRDRLVVTAYLGIDFSVKAIEMARANVPDFAFVVGDALEAPEVQKFSYDVVVCTEVLEHIEQDREVIRRWRPGAKVVATVPSYDSAAHVRHFRNADEVRARYEDLIGELTVEEIAISRTAYLFLMYGRVADRA